MVLFFALLTNSSTRTRRKFTVVRTLMRLIIGPLWLFRLPAKLIKRRSEMGGSQDKDKDT
jgi:hypothetical protein